MAPRDQRSGVKPWFQSQPPKRWVALGDSPGFPRGVHTPRADRGRRRHLPCGSHPAAISQVDRGGNELWFSGYLPGSFLHAGYQPGELDTVHRSPAGSVRHLSIVGIREMHQKRRAKLRWSY